MQLQEVGGAKDMRLPDSECLSGTETTAVSAGSYRHLLKEPCLLPDFHGDGLAHSEDQLLGVHQGLIGGL